MHKGGKGLTLICGVMAICHLYILMCEDGNQYASFGLVSVLGAVSKARC